MLKAWPKSHAGSVLTTKVEAPLRLFLPPDLVSGPAVEVPVLTGYVQHSNSIPRTGVSVFGN
jgi:hypothetical protein